MKRFLTLTCSLLLVAGSFASPSSWLQNGAAKQGTNGIAIQLAAWGVTNAADRNAIASSGYDADQTSAIAISGRAWRVACQLSTLGELSISNNIALGRALLVAIPPPTPQVFLPWLQSIPLAQRTRFICMATNMAAGLFPTQPVYSTLYTKYTVLQGIALNDPRVSEQDLATYLLAPEAMTAAQATGCKQAIKDKATALARQQLRGLVSVPGTSNGVSTVATMIAPVVTALNAPACTGLEAALQGLGGTITNVDRTALLALVATWQTNAMNGVSTPAKVTAQLGKLSAALGVDAFNRWVGVYNTGN